MITSPDDDIRIIQYCAVRFVERATLWAERERERERGGGKNWKRRLKFFLSASERKVKCAPLEPLFDRAGLGAGSFRSVK